MKLIVGLGNPGKEYEDTRHNIGYMVLDSFAKKLNIKIDKEKFNSKYQKVKIKGKDVLLVKPETYMNLSGTSVIQFVKYFKIDLDNILIIHDDLDLECGKIRLRGQGTSGGHKGIKNILEILQTKNIKRLKIGISNNSLIETKDYVLGKFSKEEKNILKKSIEITDELLNDYFDLSFDKLMNKYN